MLHSTHIQALVSRMIVSAITANVVKVNAHIASVLSSGIVETLFNAYGVLVVVTFDHNGKPYLEITSANKHFSSKLGSAINPLNKRVVGELNTWLFATVRGIAQEAEGVIKENIKHIDVNPYVLDIGLWDRIKMTRKSYSLSTGNPRSDELIKVDFMVSRNIFNRLSATVEVYTEGLHQDFLGKLLPTVSGIYSNYDSIDSVKSLNTYITEAIATHIELNLK